MENNSRKYNNFINSIEDDTIRNAFYKCTFEDYYKWGDCSILEIVKNIPFQKIQDDEKFKKFFFISPELSLLKLKDEDFLNMMDNDWSRLLNTYDTNTKIISERENEFLSKILENETTEIDENELENKICNEVNNELKNMKMQLNNKKEEIENECVLILDKMKSFFEKYNDDKDTDLTDEQIDNIFLNMNEDEKQQISELQNQFEILINKLNELDKIKIDDVEHSVEVDVAPKEDITKEYEDLEALKNSQMKFLCLIETMVSLYPKRFKTV